MFVLASRVITLFLIASLFFAAPVPVHAQTQKWSEQCAPTVDLGEGASVQVASIQGLECLLQNILATATTFIGLAAFVMFIIGGFLYLTSGSSTKGTEAAKQTITYALIGIVVALMAYFILNLIADFTGVRTFLQFDLSID